MTDKEKNNRVNALAMTFLEELQMRPHPFADQILRAYKAGYHQSEKDSLLEEPVSELWHDSNKEQPKAGSNVATWDDKSGEILTRCVRVNPNRKWAYMEDLLSKKEEPVSEDLVEAMNRAADETRLAKAKNGQPFFSEVDFNLGFSNGAQWQKQQTINKACEWLHRNIDRSMWLARFRKTMEE